MYILSIWNRNHGSTSINTYTKGLHTVMVKCLSENHFKVYNDGNYDTTYTPYFSFAELLEGKRFSCVYKIK